MKRGTTLEEFKSGFENKRYSIKGFSGLLNSYCETDIVSTETRFDKEFNRFKEKYLSLEKINASIEKSLISNQEAEEKAIKVANSYNLPCLKKEFDKKTAIVNKIKAEIAYLKEMKEVFSTFEELPNVEQFYILFKYQIICE